MRHIQTPDLRTSSIKASRKAGFINIGDTDMDTRQLIFELWASYWWLSIPFGFMVLGIIRMVVRGDIERKRLEVIKTYIDRGMDVPDALKRETF